MSDETINVRIPQDLAAKIEIAGNFFTLSDSDFIRSVLQEWFRANMNPDGSIKVRS